MKKMKFLLYVFTFLASAVPFIGNGTEIVVNTHKGESFFITMDPHATLNDLTEKVKTLVDGPFSTTLLIEMPFGEEIVAEPVSWKWDVKKHGQYLGYPRDYFTELKPDEKADIRYIITFLANKSLLSIAGHKGALEQKGDRIDHIHPLRFLLTVFTDEELKVGIRNIRAKGWVWGDFISGLKESLTTESKIQNLTDQHIAHFAQVIELDPNLLYPSASNRRWDEFIDILITQVPRKGDYNRYDS